MKKNKNIKILKDVLKTSGLSMFLIFGLNGCDEKKCNDKNNYKDNKCYNNSGTSNYVGSSSGATKHSGFFSNFSSDSNSIGS